MRTKINRYLNNAGFNYTTHDFRHTKISELVAKKIPLKTVQVYAGHTNAATTLRYVHIDQDDALNQIAATFVSDEEEKMPYG